MPKKNRQCLNCGELYYACLACIDINSWKNVCCSPECFREYLKKLQQEEKPITHVTPQKKDEGEVKKMFAILKDHRKKVKIIGYDSALEKFDGIDSKTHTEEDIECLELTLSELQEIAQKE